MIERKTEHRASPALGARAFCSDDRTQLVRVLSIDYCCPIGFAQRLQSLRCSLASIEAAGCVLLNGARVGLGLIQVKRNPLGAVV